MSYSRVKRQRVFEMTNGRCYYCGDPLDFNTFRMDFFKADTDSPKIEANLVPACPECNMCKYDLDIEGFREKLQTTICGGFHGRLMTKYFKAVPERVTFYFEREGL